MMKTTPYDIDPCKLLNQFEPLTKGTYPVFNKRPRFISDYQIIEKKKILQQEIDYLKERFKFKKKIFIFICFIKLKLNFILKETATWNHIS